MPVGWVTKPTRSTFSTCVGPSTCTSGVCDTTTKELAIDCPLAPVLTGDVQWRRSHFVHVLLCAREVERLDVATQHYVVPVHPAERAHDALLHRFSREAHALKSLMIDGAVRVFHRLSSLDPTSPCGLVGVSRP